MLFAKNRLNRTFAVFIVFLYYFFVVFFISQGSSCGVDFGQNDQKLHENYKINVLVAKQQGDMRDKLIFRVAGETPQSPSPTRGNLGPSYQIVGNHIFRRKYGWQTLLKCINKETLNVHKASTLSRVSMG